MLSAFYLVFHRDGTPACEVCPAVEAGLRFCSVYLTPPVRFERRGGSWLKTPTTRASEMLNVAFHPDLACIVHERLRYHINRAYAVLATCLTYVVGSIYFSSHTSLGHNLVTAVDRRAHGSPWHVRGSGRFARVINRVKFPRPRASLNRKKGKNLR